MDTTTARLTYADLREMPEDGNRYELIAGEIIMSPAPRPRHQDVVTELTASLRNYAREHELGIVYTAPIDLVLDAEDAAVQPDVVFIASERRFIVQETHLAGAPSLVVEVVSPSSRRRDEITKRHLYAQHRVPEYWVVDPDIDTVKVYRLPDTPDPGAGASAYVRAAELTAQDGDALTTPQLPGWSLALARLFAR